MAEKSREEANRGDEGKRGVSRRKWLIDVGKAAALAGISGKAAAIEGEGTALHGAAESQSETLPPGLYRPSLDHLTHALESDARLHAIPPDCPVDYVPPRKGPFHPQFFSPDEYKVLHRLTALMLGEESAPSTIGSTSQGAGVVDDVAEWIDLLAHSFAGIREAAERLTPEQVALAEAYDGARLLHSIKARDPQKIYRDGLAWIADESLRWHQRGFIQLNADQQSAILDAISDDHVGREGENAGTRFFRQLKDDMISGFYTSPAGLKELDYQGNKFYAESPGCKASGGPQRESGN